MRIVLALMLSCCCALLLAQAPAEEQPGVLKRNYTIRGEGLTIRPGMEQFQLSFDSGVSVTSEQFSLAAGSLDVEIAPTRLVQLRELKLPDVPTDAELMIEDPRGVARELLDQLDLPEPKFHPGALQRVAAGGGITARTQGITLKTPQLVSTDGGRSWVADQRTVITGTQQGMNLRLAADSLAYDTEAQRAVAAGNIDARFEQRGQPPVVLQASRIEYGLESGELDVSGDLRASFGDVTISTGALRGDVHSGSVRSPGAVTAQQDALALQGGSLSANLRRQSISVGGGAQLADPQRGLALAAGSLSMNLRDQQVEAGGGVELQDTTHGVTVSAGSLSVNLKTQRLEARGDPTVRYGDSTFTGEQIVVSRQGGKTIVEVSGEQRARVNVEELSEGFATAVEPAETLQTPPQP